MLVKVTQLKNILPTKYVTIAKRRRFEGYIKRQSQPKLQLSIESCTINLKIISHMKEIKLNIGSISSSYSPEAHRSSCLVFYVKKLFCHDSLRFQENI